MTNLTTTSKLTMSDVRQANKTWFSASNTRFFGTRVVSTLLKGRFFITCDKTASGDSKYTIRSVDAALNISTVGNYCGYYTKEDAKDAVKVLNTPLKF